MSHFKKYNASNIDVYSTCLIGEVDIVSSCNDSNLSSSHAKSIHDNNIENGFKVFTNPLYDENFDVGQHITCYNAYNGALHGIINPLFEERMEFLDLVNTNLDDDTLSYYNRRSDFFSSRCDNDNDGGVASYDVHNELLDEAIVEDQPTLYKEVYGEFSNMIANPFFDCKDFLNPRLVSNIEMNGIC